MQKEEDISLLSSSFFVHFMLLILFHLYQIGMLRIPLRQW